MQKHNATIDGIEIQTVEFPAMRAHRLFWRLAKVAPYVAARVDITTLRWNQGIAGMAPALLELFGRLSVEESESLMKEILSFTTAIVDGKAVQFDRPEMIDHVFSGKLPALYKVIAFVLGVNYGDFIAGAFETQDAPEQEDKASS